MSRTPSVHSTPSPTEKFIPYIPIIAANIWPGTTLMSDRSRAYNTVGQLPDLRHLTVNHSLNFVDPNSGAQSQRVNDHGNQQRKEIRDTIMLIKWCANRVQLTANRAHFCLFAPIKPRIEAMRSRDPTVIMM